MISFYEILYVRRDASHEEIVEAYRKRVIETHPDRGGNPIEFMNVRKGYEILSDPQRRMQYDRWLSEKEGNIKNKNEGNAKTGRDANNARNTGENPNDNIKLELLRKRSSVYSNAILNKYVKHYTLYKKIKEILDSDLSVFRDIDTSLLNKKVASIAIKKCIYRIANNREYPDFKELFDLEIICNNILTDKIDIDVSKDGHNKDKHNNDSWSLFIFVSVVIIAITLLTVFGGKKSDNRDKINYLESLRASDSTKDNISSLYNALISKGYTQDNLGDEMTFRRKMADGKSRKQLYDYVLSRGDFSIGNYDEYERRILSDLMDSGMTEKQSERPVSEQSFHIKFPKIKDDKNKEGKENTTKTVNKSHGTKKENSNVQEKTYNETVFQTGDMPYYEYFGKGKYDMNSLSKLTLINYSSTDAVVLLVSNYYNVIRNVFVKQGSEYTMNYIPEGKYIVKIMFGNSWNKEKYNGGNLPKGGFMRNTHFTKSSWNDAFDYTFERLSDGINYPTYSLTLQKVRNGNFSTNDISKDDFFN